MAWRRSVVYAAVDGAGCISFHYSPRPEVDAAWQREQGTRYLVPLHPPLPPVWAREAAYQLQRYADRAAEPMELGEPAETARSAGSTDVAEPAVNGLSAFWRRLFGRPGSQRSPRSVVKRSVARTRRQLAAVGYRWNAHVLDGLTWSEGADRGLAAGGLARRRGAEEDARRPATDDDARQPDIDADMRWPATDDLEAVARLVEGRLLDELEILQLSERAGLDPDSPVEDCLTALTLLGRVKRRPGMERTAFGGWRCLRCGETENIALTDCAACGEAQCAECGACRGLGVVRGCTFLYAGVVTERQDVREPVSFLSHKLTPAQARAAQGLEQFVAADERREALVWAVCGAGKTELCFPAVARVLGAGGRVLFAIPRRDIVKELGGRLRQAFPDVATEVLHGGRGRVERWGLASGTLTVATTHQVLRFEDAFDLIIVDEVDAFPYCGSPMLQRGVERAVRLNGRIVHMSATPSKSLVKRADAGASCLITVPVRHHGHPLPVPRLHRNPWLEREPIVRIGTIEERDPLVRIGTVPDWEATKRAGTAADDEAIVRNEIDDEVIVRNEIDDEAIVRNEIDDEAIVRNEIDDEAIVRNGPILLRDPIARKGFGLLFSLIKQSLTSDPPARAVVFVPDVASTERIGRIIIGAVPQTRSRVLWSHSQDPERDRKLSALQQGLCDVFVATTILERGVTIPDVDVIVLFADRERVFSEATLVQMAGRVGRSTARPTGRVHFIGVRISPAMKAAVKQIERLNAAAAGLGLLRETR